MSIAFLSLLSLSRCLPAVRPSAGCPPCLFVLPVLNSLTWIVVRADFDAAARPVDLLQAARGSWRTRVRGCTLLGGQGLIAITSKVMAFRLLSLRRLLYTDVSWKALAHCLLRQTGKLGYDQELFLIDTKKVDIASVPLFYRSVLEAWQAVTMRRDNYPQNHKHIGGECSRLLVPLRSTGLLCTKYPSPNAPETCSGDWHITFYPPMFYLMVVSNAEEDSMYILRGPGADQNPRGVFTVDPVTGQIRVMHELDREIIPEYKLQLHAVSMNGIQKESPTTIIIKVLDINDNLPQFTQPQYKGFVMEGSPAGTSVLTVSAVDQDDPETPNAMIRYNIIWQSAKWHHDEMFGVHSESGIIITLRSGIDREKLSEYNLLVEARDHKGAPHGLSTTSSVVIAVTDINDNLPEFFKHKYRGGGRENVVGIVVANLTVSDKDEIHSPAWRAVYKVVLGDPENRILVKTNPINNDGMVTVVKPLDYESGKVMIEVRVENEIPLVQGGLQHLSTATILIGVTDVNEAPVFESSLHKVTVSEDIPVGREVARMKAHDPDVFLNQDIRYEMWDDPLQWLTIDPLTGVVKTQTPLDREHDRVVANVYEALVIGVDTGNPVATGTGTLHLKLDDVNDNTPLVSHNNVTQCLGQLINISATDADLPPNTGPFFLKLVQEPELPEAWALRTLSVNGVSVKKRCMKENGVHVRKKSAPERECDTDTECESECTSECECGSGTASDTENEMVERVRECTPGMVVELVRGSTPERVSEYSLLGSKRLSDGTYRLLFEISDSGTPALTGNSSMTVSVCWCDAAGNCAWNKITIIIRIVLGPMIFVAFVISLLICMKRITKGNDASIIPDENDYPKDQILQQDTQGEEQDQTYDLSILLAVVNPYPMKLTPIMEEETLLRCPKSFRSDIEDFIDKLQPPSFPPQQLHIADNNPTAPPNDSVTVFHHRGDGSLAASLSSINLSSSDRSQDYEYL
uniref:B-cadherin-like n=1 Tax=Myxine glutinosa TaxID=7769 RepID=UPI00358DF090